MSNAVLACGILFDGNHCDPHDEHGCCLELGHSGRHEFIDPTGERYEWETDLECDCSHCRKADGDYCALYRKKEEQ